MENNASYSKVPVKVGFWGNVKSFWFQPITLELNQKKRISSKVYMIFGIKKFM